MNGAVTIESLAHDLDTMKSLGFHAVTAQAGGGMAATYLSPEYFAFFKQFVARSEEARHEGLDRRRHRLSLGLRRRHLRCQRREARPQHAGAHASAARIPVKAGDTLNQAVGPDTVAAVAVSSTGEHVAVPITGGNINWTAPAGSRLDRHAGRPRLPHLAHQERHQPHPRQGLHPAARGLPEPRRHRRLHRSHPQRLLQGHARALRHHHPRLPRRRARLLHRRPALDARPSSTPSSRPRATTSAPTWRRSCSRRAAAGSVLPPVHARPANGAPQSDPAFIPAGPPLPTTKLSDAELRAKADYYDVFSQMFRDGFFKPQGVWCAAHGVAYQVHLNHEEMEMDLTRSEGDFLRDMKYVEVPGIDAIWHQIWTDTISDYPRLASSAAHVYGHPQSFTESFAAYRPAPDITMARYIINEQLVRGINLIETMFYPATHPESAVAPADLRQRLARSSPASARRPSRLHARSRLARADGLHPPHQLRHEHGPPRRLCGALHPVQLHVAQRPRLRHRLRLHRAHALRAPDRLRHHQPGRTRHRPQSRPRRARIHERQPLPHRHHPLRRGPLTGRA